jgi:hypothetical protein
MMQNGNERGILGLSDHELSSVSGGVFGLERVVGPMLVDAAMAEMRQMTQVMTALNNVLSGLNPVPGK